MLTLTFACIRKAEAALACDARPQQPSLMASVPSGFQCAGSVGDLRPELVTGTCSGLSLSRGGKEMLAVIYTFGISVVAAFLFAAVNVVEPNRRYASVLKLLIVFVSVAAIAGKLMP